MYLLIWIYRFLSHSSVLWLFRWISGAILLRFVCPLPLMLWFVSICHLPFFPSSACDKNSIPSAQGYDLMFIRLWGTGHACNFWEQPICQRAFKLQVHEQMMINTLLSPPTSSDTFVCAHIEWDCSMHTDSLVIATNYLQYVACVKYDVHITLLWSLCFR